MPRHRRAPSVHKFGGASLADSPAVCHAVEIIGSYRPEPTIVVVSAMAGVTDALVSEGVASFSKAFDDLLGAIAAKHPATA